MEKPVDCGINGDRLDQPTCDGKSAMPGKRVQFDDETWNALDLLAKDRMQDFQELADEAFSDLLRKHGRPTDLKTALRQSEMRFFSHMQEVCPQLLPVVTDDPWQTMHGWLLLERRVASGPGRRPKSRPPPQVTRWARARTKPGEWR